VIDSVRLDNDRLSQENAHLKAQIEQLSRCQNPREFAISAPATIELSKRTAVELANMGLKGQSIGWKPDDLQEDGESLQKRVDIAVSRWKQVVKAARGSGGLAVQRSFSSNNGLDRQSGQQPSTNGIANGEANGHNEGMDLDADGEVDADADVEDDTYSAAASQMTEQNGLHAVPRVPEAPMMYGDTNSNALKSQHQQQPPHQQQMQGHQLRIQPETPQLSMRIQQSQPHHSMQSNGMGNGQQHFMQTPQQYQQHASPQQYQVHSQQHQHTQQHQQQQQHGMQQLQQGNGSIGRRQGQLMSNGQGATRMVMPF
jgi:hypothetical protein